MALIPEAQSSWGMTTMFDAPDASATASRNSFRTVSPCTITVTSLGPRRIPSVVTPLASASGSTAFCPASSHANAADK